MTLIIPAYQPDALLPELVGQCGEYRIVVVDDGSDARCVPHFEACAALGATILRHPVNRGKGAALKTAFAWVLEHGPEAVVCADADGQHTPADISTLALAIADKRATLLLGVRRRGPMPLRSSIGNRTMKALFFLSTGRWLPDTQTGLRAATPDILAALCELPGDRYEYEMEQLLGARRRGYSLASLPISLIYLEGNVRSHFNPLRDSLRVLRTVLLFWASSLAATVVDYGVVWVLHEQGLSLWVPVTVARLASAGVNFLINRKLVFGKKNGSLMRQMLAFFAVQAAVLGLSLAGIWALTVLGLPFWPAKIAMDLFLMAVNFFAQNRFVFRPMQGNQGGE